MICNAVLAVGAGAYLRQLTPDDISDRYVDGINSPAVKAFLSQPNTALQSRESLREYVSKARSAKDVVLFGLFVDGAHSGNIRLHDITLSQCWIGIALFDAAIWGKGFGSAAIRQAAQHAVDRMAVGRVLAGIADANRPSVRAFEKAGFRRLVSDLPFQPEPGNGIWKFPN